MKLKSMNKTVKYTKFLFIAGCIVIIGELLITGQSFGKTAKEIDASADAVMDRFYNQVKDAKEFVKRSKGLLIFPSVKKGALIVGGEYGKPYPLERRQGLVTVHHLCILFWLRAIGVLFRNFVGQIVTVYISHVSDRFPADLFRYYPLYIVKP